MKKEQIALTIIGAFAVIVSLKFPVWGVITLERKLDTYPLHAPTLTTHDHRAGWGRQRL